MIKKLLTLYGAAVLSLSQVTGCGDTCRDGFTCEGGSEASITRVYHHAYEDGNVACLYDDRGLASIRMNPREGESNIELMVRMEDKDYIAGWSIVWGDKEARVRMEDGNQTIAQELASDGSSDIRIMPDCLPYCPDHPHTPTEAYAGCAGATCESLKKDSLDLLMTDGKGNMTWKVFGPEGIFENARPFRAIYVDDMHDCPEVQLLLPPRKCE